MGKITIDYRNTDAKQKVRDFEINGSHLPKRKNWKSN